DETEKLEHLLLSRPGGELVEDVQLTFEQPVERFLGTAHPAPDWSDGAIAPGIRARLSRAINRGCPVSWARASWEIRCSPSPRSRSATVPRWCSMVFPGRCRREPAWGSRVPTARENRRCSS